MIIPLAMGALSTLAAMQRAAATPFAGRDARLEMERRGSCTVAIVLVAPGTSPVSNAIDRATGSRGFSTAYLDPCAAWPNGENAIIACRPGLGVHWTTPRIYGDRRVAAIVLEGPLGFEVFGCARSKLGRPFAMGPLIAGRRNEDNCIGLIWSCLPPSLRSRIGRPGRIVSPNDFALFFGVRPGGAVTYREGG